MRTENLNLDASNEQQPEQTSQSETTEDQLLQQELDKLLGIAQEIEGEQAPENEEGTSDTQEEKEAPSDENITSPDEESDPDQTEFKEEEKTLEERLQEVEAKAKQEEDASLRGQLKRMEDQLKEVASRLESTNFLDGLPQGGVYEKDGRPIYELNQKDMNDYLLELRDNGRELEAGYVQTAYTNAIENAKKYKKDFDTFQTYKQQVAEAQDYVEWVEVKEEVQKNLPELTQDDFIKVGQFIDAMAAKDSLYAAAITNKAGKLQKGIEALQQLGILERLRKQATNATIKQPSAPDARLASKKVKGQQTGSSTYRQEDVAAMNQAAFNKLPEDELDKLLADSMSQMLKGR